VAQRGGLFRGAMAHVCSNREDDPEGMIPRSRSGNREVREVLVCVRLRQYRRARA
jgi:hypothetical protein